MKLVLLPGLDGSSSLRNDFVNAFAGSVDCLCVAYPVDATLGYTELEELVRTQLPARGRYVLLGESFSGPIAISIAATNPRGLAGVILCASFARTPRPAISTLLPLAGIFPPSLIPQVLLGRLLLGAHAPAGLRSQLQSAVSELSSSAISARLQAVADIDVSAQLASMILPLLYLRAERDRVVPAASATHVTATYPRTQVVCVPGPHCLLQTNPDEVAAVVREFIRAVQSSR